uniref:Vesicle-fusing ATPase n=2 Tax=Chrysotila carterae TaxID=13221 RepID=A0A7S4B2N9_CHRCT
MIVRRTLSSRLYPPALTRELGLSPVKGMLLYGPPGCGKTLLAREISAALGAREPKIVNGPEMMNKYVGESESFVRALFAEAELEQMEAGDQSALHIIVLDELDAFCRERGALRGDTSGIRDSVVNQLLAKLDGVEELNNILVIGLTNRPELIDAALLRPGRLEVHVKVDLPDEAGRQTILGIHSRKLRQRGCFDAAALAAIGGGALAKSTFGYSGAQLAGLLRSATSFALERYTDAALLRGWVPGDAKQAERRASGRAAEGRHGKGVKLSGASAASEAGVDGGEGGLGDDGLLQVEFEDLARALRENAIEGSWQGRSKLALKVGAWRRQRLLRRYTQKLLE